MEKFVVNKLAVQYTGEYSGTLILEGCQKAITGIKFSVESETGDVVRDKLVADRYILTGIPRPFFEKRLGRTSLRASRLAQALNYGSIGTIQA
jgi:hypothetical protein